MGSFSTAFPTSAKSEYPSALHRFEAQVAPTGNVTSGSQHVASVSSMTGVAPGCTLAGTGIPSGSFVADIDSTSSFYFGGNGSATATNSGVTLTIAGDTFKCALGIGSPAGTYGAATTNYSNLTGNSDEVTGAGYTAGGFAWTPAQNIAPATSGTGAFWQWNVNPNWTSATISTSGCIIYNTSSTNRAVYVGSFGGIQSVVSGTLTLLLPANGVGTSLLQIN
jgi:hypothetical protein